MWLKKTRQIDNKYAVIRWHKTWGLYSDSKNHILSSTPQFHNREAALTWVNIYGMMSFFMREDHRMSWGVQEELGIWSRKQGYNFMQNFLNN